jgi:hypothetical protein
MKAKFIKDKLFEKFEEYSDPIHDMQIDYNWVVIKKGTQLPDDFIIDDGEQLNHDVYIIEAGNEKENWWMNEYESMFITIEIIGGMIIGAKRYKDVRFRNRTIHDKKWNIEETQEYRMFKALYPDVK